MKLSTTQIQNKKINKNNNINIYFIFGVIAIIVIWFITSLASNNIFLPKIDEVLKDVIVLVTSKQNIIIMLLSLLKLILVICCAYLISFIIGILSYKYKWFRSFISPFIAIMRSIPVASVIIILILLVGVKSAPIIITLLVIVPLASENIYASFNSVDNDLIEETKMVSKINLNIVLRIFIPVTTPLLISSFLTSFGLGLKVMVMSELLTQSSNTIGSAISLAKTNLDAVRVFSWTIILITFVMIVEGITKMIKNKL